jgi:hypothetical protein
LCKGIINELQKNYQPRTNLVNDEKGDFLADTHSTLNSRKHHSCQVLNTHGLIPSGRLKLTQLNHQYGYKSLAFFSCDGSWKDDKIK